MKNGQRTHVGKWRKGATRKQMKNVWPDWYGNEN